jgi:hypothetical protein
MVYLILTDFTHNPLRHSIRDGGNHERRRCPPKVDVHLALVLHNGLNMLPVEQRRDLVEAQAHKHGNSSSLLRVKFHWGDREKAIFSNWEKPAFAK